MSPLPRKKKDEHPEDQARQIHEELEIQVELATYTPEEQNVIAWREDTLRRAGVNGRTATLLARSLSADLHETLRLKARGCTDQLLLEIMR